MPFPSAVELKKLAAACRKAGVKSYKTAEFEIQLSEEAPEPSNYRKRKAKSQPSNALADLTPFESDTPTEDELMFWSVGEDPTVAFGGQE